MEGGVSGTDLQVKVGFYPDLEGQSNKVTGIATRVRFAELRTRRGLRINKHGNWQGTGIMQTKVYYYLGTSRLDEVSSEYI